MHTFLFADLAGFTALTEVHGDELAVDLVDDFCGRTRELLGRYGAEEIKGIGDALMLRCADAGQAIALALRITGEIGGRHEFPSVRVGMHTGPAVERGGDWFGSTVNVASRVCGEATAGEVLITSQTLETAGDRFAYRSRGRKALKNVGEPIELFAVSTQSEAADERLVIDPVCRMAVDPARTERRAIHAGTEYRFCSEACASAFAADPAKYHGLHSSRSELLLSDRGRDWATGVLRKAYQHDRISTEELERRLARLYVARTRGESSALLSDLPEYRRARIRAWRRGMAERLVPGLRRWRRRRT